MGEDAENQALCQLLPNTTNVIEINNLSNISIDAIVITVKNVYTVKLKKQGSGTLGLKYSCKAIVFLCSRFCWRD